MALEQVKYKYKYINEYFGLNSVIKQYKNDKD